jgi:hypothetical protein
MADLAGPQLLRFGREAQEGIDLVLHEQVDGLDVTGHPIDVLEWVESNMGGHCGDEDVWIRAQGMSRADGFAFQVHDTVDAFVREQFITTDMHASEHLDRRSLVDRNGKCCRIVQSKIDVTTGQHRNRGKAGLLVDIPKVGQSLGPDQLFSDILWRNADPRRPREADSGRFEQSLLGRDASRASQCGSSGCRETSQEVATSLDALHQGLLRFGSDQAGQTPNLD